MKRRQSPPPPPPAPPATATAADERFNNLTGACRATAQHLTEGGDPHGCAPHGTPPVWKSFPHVRRAGEGRGGGEYFSLGECSINSKGQFNFAAPGPTGAGSLARLQAPRLKRPDGSASSFEPLRVKAAIEGKQ